MYLIIGSMKDHLGVPREGVWVVSVCRTEVSLSIAFSKGIAC